MRTPIFLSKHVFLVLIVSLVSVLGTGCSEDPALATGNDVYSKYCVTCHQADGAGIPGAFPTLQDTEWVNGDKGRLIRLVLRGMQGPIEVKGESFSNVMTPHDFLSDAQVAAVITFVRQGFSNNSDEVTENEVMRVRSSLTGKGLFMASELKFRTGIPELEVETE